MGENIRYLYILTSTYLFILLNIYLSNSQATNDVINKLSPEEIVRLEIEEFEKEVEEFIKIRNEEIESSRRREKRTVIFNTETPINLGLILGIPFTVILPTLTNFFNWKWKRSTIDEDEDTNDIFEEDPIIQPHLDRISTYFELIKIPEKSCQERAICEFSADPEKYYPISELVLNRIRNPSLPLMAYIEDKSFNTNFNFNNNSMSGGLNETVQKNNNNRNSLFKLYSQAADEGLVYGNPICTNKFGSKCPHSIEKRLNMPVLKFWNLLSSLLKFSISDDIHFHN